MSNLFWLTEAQMARLRPFFPKSYGRPRVDDLRVLNGLADHQTVNRRRDPCGQISLIGQS